MASAAARDASRMAEECLALCRAHDVDPYLLFSLRHWHWMEHSRFGKQFKAFIEQHTRVTGAAMAHGESWRAFKKRVVEEIDRTGVVNIAPHLRVEAYRMEELLDKYHRVRSQWPPHKPYLIQMRPGLFILLSNCQAGFHLVREMARTGRYTSGEGKTLAVELLYEKQVVGEPCRIILDCEAYTGDYDGVMSKEELVESMRHVPVMLTRELVRAGGIRREDKVIVVEKNKSREAGADARGDKVSFHFVFNIVGTPTGDLKHMFEQLVLAPYRAVHARAKKAKSAAEIARLIAASQGEDRVYAAALAHVDPSTVKGMHQFSLVFSRKKKEPPPRIDWIYQLTEGGAHGSQRESAFHGVPLAAGHARALDMLYLGGFMHWTPNTIVLAAKFRIAAPAQDIGLAGAAVSLDRLFLFGWPRHETRTHVHPPRTPVVMAGKKKEAGGRPPARR